MKEREVEEEWERMEGRVKEAMENMEREMEGMEIEKRDDGMRNVRK